MSDSITGKKDFNKLRVAAMAKKGQKERTLEDIDRDIAYYQDCLRQLMLEREQFLLSNGE